MELTDDPRDADVLLLIPVHREKARKGLLPARPLADLETARPGLIIGVGGCVASQKGALRQRAPTSISSSARKPCTGCRPYRGGTAAPPPGGGYLLPGDRKIRPAAGAARRGRRLRVHHGRLQQILHFCVVPYTRGEEFSRPFDDVIAESVAWPNRGARNHPARPERQRLSGSNGRRDSRDLALLLHYIAAIDGIDRIRYTTSHPVEFPPA